MYQFTGGIYSTCSVIVWELYGRRLSILGATRNLCFYNLLFGEDLTVVPKETCLFLAVNWLEIIWIFY